MSESAVKLPGGAYVEADSSEQSLQIQRFKTLDQVEREHIELVLRMKNGHKYAASAILGISTKTLYNKLEQYGLHERRPQSRKNDIGV